MFDGGWYRDELYEVVGRLVSALEEKETMVGGQESRRGR